MGYRLEKGTTSASLDRPPQVVLATPAAVKVTGVIPWIHHTRVKKTVASCDEGTGKTVWDPKIPSKSGSENNSPHPQKTLSPALVTPEVTPEVHAQQKLEDSSALLQPHSGKLAGQCMVEA